MWSFIIALTILQISYGISVPYRKKVCPLELGIVLDASNSIWPPDFNDAKAFLQKFLQGLDIGSGSDEVRVSIIPYANKLYLKDAFDLTKYATKKEVIDAIGRIVQNGKGNYTETGLAIEHMRTKQLTKQVVRPEVIKIGLVITDGQSQDRVKTATEAKSARDDGIIMFAVGVGNGTNDTELNNIAGDSSRVTKVKTFSMLNSIIKKLTKDFCDETITTTIAPPDDQPCESSPSDVYFVFSPADQGIDYTTWTTSFISRLILSEKMKTGFRYGVISGSCPDDAGFFLNRYTNVNEIRQRLQSYDVTKLASLTKQLASDGFTKNKGARENASKVAVLFVGSEKSSRNLAEGVNQLVKQGVKVFIAGPLGTSVRIPGTTTLQGNNYNQVTELVNYLCHKKPFIFHSYQENRTY